MGLRRVRSPLRRPRKEVWSRGPHPPFTIVAGLPEAHLDPASAKLLANLPAGGGPQSRNFPVPVASGLIGLELAFQAFDSPDVVTRPVMTVLRP